jgi:tetratricopeptide (TPR) repeat protein
MDQQPALKIKTMTLLQTSKSINIPQTIQRALDYHRQGKLPQAEKLYANVLAVRPDYFEALHMLGLIKLSRGELAGALRLLAEAMQARPKSPEVLLNYGVVLEALGRYEEALAIFDLVLSVKRRSVEAYNNRGAVLEKLGRDEEAFESLQCALEIKPNHADSLYNQGSVLRKLGRHEEALRNFDRVLTIKPEYAKAHNNRGLTLDALGRGDHAVKSYERALAIAPDFVEALNNRGNALQKLDRHKDALACYDRALAINPHYAEVLNNRGRSLSFLGHHEEALADCSRAIALKPDYIDAQWNEALLRLRLGDFSVGWRQYEWRWKRGEGLKRQRTFDKPLWLGESPVAGKTILVHYEQGLGDTIQFARYAPLLAEQGARVILEVQPPLKSLLSPIGDCIEVIGAGEEIPNFDLQCPIMSLPLAFRTDLATIPGKIPYLTVRSEWLQQWNKCLPPRQGLRVGIVWSGNATHKNDHNRSIALTQIAPIFDLPDIQFISLQKDPRDGDAEILTGNPRILDFCALLRDYSDTAALIAQVDLVISVDTSVAHLAGALGKPAWILLPLCSDWRWLLDRDDSPWYPTARLFRQPSIGDWDSVIRRVRQELCVRASSGV